MPDQDPFAAYGGHALLATPPPVQQEVQNPPSDPFVAYGGYALSPAPVPQPAAPQPTAQSTSPADAPEATSADPFAAYGGHAITQEEAHASSENEPESSSWLGKAWDTLNKPLLNLKREHATGIEAGAEDFASGLTSPLNVALTVGTLGAGPLLESLGIKLVGEAALPAIKTIGRLVKAGFTGTQIYGMAQEYPQLQVAIKNGDTDAVLESATKLALGGALAFHGAREVAKDVGLVDSEVRENTGVDEARGQREATAQSVYQEAREARKAVMDVAPNQVRRGAIQLFTEAGGDAEKLAEWKAKVDAGTNDIDAKTQKQLSSLLDVAQDLKPEEIEASKKLRDYYDSIGMQGVDAGLLTPEKLGSYVARSRWVDEPAEADALQVAKEKLGQAQPGRSNHLQRRVFENTVEGALNGFKPESLDAANIAADYGTSLGRELGNKAYVDAALKARAADGRPLAVPQNSIRLADDGTRLDTSDYSAVPSPHSQNLEFHPDAAKQAKLILAPERSAVADVPVAKQLLHLSTLAKETKLIGGFHWSQIGLRNLMSGVNPFTPEAIDLTDARQAKMVAAGGIQLASPRDYAFISEGEAGAGGLLAKVPGIGQFIKRTNDALFSSNGYIDQSKMKAALSFADRLKDAHPDWDEQTVNRYAGEAANNRFGGLNWTALEKNATYKDLLRTIFLAPDFLISNIKDGLSSLGPAGRINRFDIARIAAYNFAAARVANALVNGKPHFEQPFGVVSPDGKEVYSVRTMPADIFGGLADPRRFVGNRLSPLANTMQEVVTGRDKLGRTRSTAEQITDLFSNFVPMPAQNAFEVATGSSHADFRPADSVISSLGVSATKNYSPAERKALSLASHFSTSGESTPTVQLDKMHEVQKLEDSIRSGSISVDAAKAALDRGEISRVDYKNISKVAKEQEQFPETARLRSQVRRLPLSAALDVWKLASNDERADLLPIIHKKAISWNQRAAQNATPRQRQDMRLRLAGLASDILGK
jgi:hypothetical protein